jgi:hypothetical protein
MISVIRQVRTVLAAAALVASLAGVQTAFAAGTDAGVTIGNRATVNYTVGTAAQAPIESSPTGNSNPGVGNGINTNFTVDRRIDFDVVETGGGGLLVTPGQSNVVAMFTVTNTSNAAQGFQLSASNLVGGALFGNTDNTDVGNLRVFVDNPGAGGSANVYDAAFDTLDYVNTLGEDLSAVVFIVADVPLTVLNGQFANVRLTAQGAVVGSNGATLEAETVGADTSGMDVVFGARQQRVGRRPVRGAVGGTHDHQGLVDHQRSVQRDRCRSQGDSGRGDRVRGVDRQYGDGRCDQRAAL